MRDLSWHKMRPIRQFDAGHILPGDLILADGMLRDVDRVSVTATGERNLCDVVIRAGDWERQFRSDTKLHGKTLPGRPDA